MYPFNIQSLSSFTFNLKQMYQHQSQRMLDRQHKEYNYNIADM